MSSSASGQIPMFRIGGKTDPGRFVSQHQQNFTILGFHDEERSADLRPTRHRMSIGSPAGHRRNFALSPVREDGKEQRDLVSSLQDEQSQKTTVRKVDNFLLEFGTCPPSTVHVAVE